MRAARDYVSHPRGVSLKDKKLVLSKIYSWYGDDFGGKKGIRHHLISYSSSALETKLMLSDGIAEYVYDWKLNDASSRE